jgi:hypothetical protein
LGGDFNTPTDGLQALLSQAGDWHWRDGYLAGGGAEARATVPITAGERQGRCIDYILSITRDQTAHPEFRNAMVVLAERCDGLFPSDHRGVLVELVRPEVAR